MPSPLEESGEPNREQRSVVGIRVGLELRTRPPAAHRMPRPDRVVDLRLTSGAEVRPRESHELHSRGSFDCRYKRDLVPLLRAGERNDGSSPDSAYAFNDVAIRHGDAHGGDAWRRWGSREEGALSLE